MREKRRRRRKLRRKMQRILAWTALIAFELICSAAPTALTAAILIPLAGLERGGRAFGGEWLAVAGVFCIAYYLIHRRICEEIFKEV